ncbi:MAG TPA: SCO family protein [Verrucomicrobiae bacterium]|nr:SCO family protein [Verrucomicrobiae bacterium]
MVRSCSSVILLALLATTGCKKPSDDTVTFYTHEPLQEVRQVFQVRGLVVEVKPLGKSITIKHEEIPGYMSAMSMPFEVKDTNLLAGLEPGDPVYFRLVVTEAYGYIDAIQKTGPKTNSPPTTGPFRLVRDVEPLKPGESLPEYHFTNELGRPFSTADYRGQALAVEFLFTRCPFPNFCPFMARTFQSAQTNLLGMAGSPTNWHLLTISFDPDFDTPEVLKGYAESHGYNSNRWTFATGELIDITAIGDQLGLSFWRDEAGSISHNLRVGVFDASGRLRKIFTGNQWTSQELADEMVKAAAAQN